MDYDRENASELIDLLNRLIKVDSDAVLAYTQAITNVDHELTRDYLISFRSDHDLHCTENATRVIQLGGDPFEPPYEGQKFTTDGFMEIPEGVGMFETLEAIKTNEEIVNRTYEQVRSEIQDEDLKLALTPDCDDESRHVNFLAGILHEKPWNHLRHAS